MPARELLTSDLVRVFVRVAGTAAHWEGFTERVPAALKVRDVLRAHNVLGEPFRVEAQPLPYPGFPDACNAPVFPAMTIEVRPPPDWGLGAPSPPRIAVPEPQMPERHPLAEEDARRGPAPDRRGVNGSGRAEGGTPPSPEGPSPFP